MNKIDKLNELSELYKTGTLTKEEYEHLKDELLNDGNRKSENGNNISIKPNIERNISEEIQTQNNHPRKTFYNSNKKILYAILVIAILGLLYFTNNKKSESIKNTNDIEKNDNIENVVNTNEIEKTLVFQRKVGIQENQISTFKLVIKGESINVIYQYLDNEPSTHTGYYKNGKIVIDNQDDKYLIDSSNETFSVLNPETDERDLWHFNREKSSTSIADVLNGTSKSMSSTNKMSFSEIRSLVISGSKQNMLRHLGEPNEKYSADDFMKKYYNWEAFSVYSVNRLLYSIVFLYENIDNSGKTILVVYNSHNGKVYEVMYKDDLKSYEDLSVNFGND